MDGKVANDSEVNTSNDVVKKINAMSVYSIKYNKTLATEFIDSKTNEIPTYPKLLARLNIKEAIITFDILNNHSIVHNRRNIHRVKSVQSEQYILLLK